MGKKFLLTGAVFAVFVFNAFSQGGQKWASGLNIASSTDALGTSNNFPLVVKTNGQERLRVQETGELLLQHVAGYSADYSALFTPNSLVSKQYVDNAIAALPPPVTPNLIGVLTAGRNVDLLGTINDNAGRVSVDINGRKLFNTLGSVKLDWEQGYLYNAPGPLPPPLPPPAGNTISLKWISRELVGVDGVVPSLTGVAG